MKKIKAKNPLNVAGYLRALPRVFDARPLWAQLNVTWKCNLTCGYCSEYDNSKGHVPFAEIVSLSISAKHWVSFTPTSSVANPCCIPRLCR